LEKNNDTNRNSTVTHRSPPFIRSDFGPKTCHGSIGRRAAAEAEAEIGGGRQRSIGRRAAAEAEAEIGGGRQRPETGDRRWRRAEAEAEAEAGAEAEAEAEAEADAIHRLLAKLGPTSARWF